jgi:hypothetical protein
MIQWFNQLIDRISEYLANRKGLLPLVGILLVILNAVLQFVPSMSWLVTGNLMLHIGVIIAIIGIMLAWAL